MTCKEMNLWLLATDLLASPPREVRSHLDSCHRCHQQHHRLLHLHETVHDLPVPPPSSDARARLLRSLQNAPGPRPAHWPRFHWYALTFAGAAALLLVILGAAVINGVHQRTDDTADQKEPENKRAAAEQHDVLGSALDRHLQLAKGPPSAEKFQVLMGLANDLHAESLRLAKAPASADLAAVVRLYQRVVREGRLAERADALALADKQRLLVPLLPELRQNETAAAQLAENAPADVARSLRALTATTRDLRGKLGNLVGEKML
jgi:hypothetical protein